MNLRKDHYHILPLGCFPQRKQTKTCFQPSLTRRLRTRPVDIYKHDISSSHPSWWVNNPFTFLRNIKTNQNNHETWTAIFVKQNNDSHFQQWMSWLPQRWRTQRNAIRNANCNIQWVIKTLNATCTASAVCLLECLFIPTTKPRVFVKAALSVSYPVGERHQLRWKYGFPRGERTENRPRFFLFASPWSNKGFRRRSDATSNWNRVIQLSHPIHATK